MAKISDYSAITSTALDDLLVVVDVDDTTMAASGTTKKMTLAQLYQPWQFLPQSYGAAGDGKVITDATITSGQLSTLTSASAGFTLADTGKSIVVSQAGGSAAAPLATTITYVSATTVTLATAASNAVSGVGAIYGTDDTVAVQDAVSAAVACAQGTIQYAEVVFPPAYYCIAGAPVLGGTTLGNAQIILPIITANTGTKVNLAFRGLASVAAAPEHWLNPNIDAPGAVLVCMRTDGTYDTVYGPAAVIGGPVDGYGGGGGTYSNMQVIVDGLTVLVPYSPSYSGLCLYGMGQMKIGAFSYMPMAVVPSGAPWPQLVSGGPASSSSAGIIAPVTGNNDLNEVDSYTCYGADIGISGADHLAVRAMRTLFCFAGWVPATGLTGGVVNHGASILNWSSEATAYPIYAALNFGWDGYRTDGAAPVTIQALDLESYTSVLADEGSGASAHVQGVCWFEDLDSASGLPYLWGSSLQLTLNLKLLAMSQFCGVLASPPSVPGTDTAFGNYFYRDATVYITSGGAAVTAVKIDGTATGLTLGSSGTVPVRVPSGHTITLTYASTAPAWEWVLD